jgi:UDP-N-acetylglucosamine 4-epimerase
VDNVVQANILAATSPTDLGGRVYNVALGRRTTLMQLFELLRDAMQERGFDCEQLAPNHQDFRPGDIRHSLADITAARRDLDYEPSVDLRSGLIAVVDASVKPG